MLARLSLISSAIDQSRDQRERTEYHFQHLEKLSEEHCSELSP